MIGPENFIDEIKLRVPSHNTEASMNQYEFQDLLNKLSKQSPYDPNICEEMYEQMEMINDTSCHGFCSIYYKAIDSINQKKIKQENLIDYFTANKSMLRRNLLNKNEYTIRNLNGVLLGMKLIKLKVPNSENPFIKIGYLNERNDFDEVGRIFNDEHDPISFLRDHVFEIEYLN